MKSVAPSRAWALLPIVVFLAGWEALYRTGVLPPSQATGPSDVLSALVTALWEGTLGRHVAISLARLGGAMLIGSILGILSGMSLSRLQILDITMSPGLRLVAPIPVVVWIPFLIMLLGLGEPTKVATVALSTFFVVNLHVYKACKAIRAEYMDLAKIYQKSLKDQIVDIVLPATSGAIFVSVRISLALGWVALAVVESSFSNTRDGGLGWYILNEKGWGRIETQFAAVGILAALGFMFDWLTERAELHLCKWERA